MRSLSVAATGRPWCILLCVSCLSLNTVSPQSSAPFLAGLGLLGFDRMQMQVAKAMKGLTLDSMGFRPISPDQYLERAR